MTVSQVQQGCNSRTSEGKYGGLYERSAGVIRKHLRKMVIIKQLDREKQGNAYVYWNPAMVSE
jgi:hypothetical protein